MAYKPLQNCLISILAINLMLLYQPAFSQEGFNKTSEWMEENLQKLGGRAVLLIYKDGKIVYNHAENKLGPKQKIRSRFIARRTGKDAAALTKDYDAHTKIAIASCSKWLSAALVMTFVDEGKLKLSDTIGKYLPVMSENGKGNISISECLSHTTGIASDGLKENKNLFSNTSNMDEVMNAIAQKPMEGAHGTVFHYSSIGLQIAAAVIEKISGKNFETLFAERIAKPCGMHNTDFGNKKIPLPAGGAQSTAKDYLNFLVMILNKGKFNGKQVISAASVDLMQQDHTSGVTIRKGPAEAGSWGYGYGEWTMQEASGKPSPAVTSPGLFGSFPWVDNNAQYAAVLFTFNLKNKGRNELYRGLKKIVDQEIKE